MKRILLSLTMVLAFLIGCERSGYEFDHGHDEGLPNGNVTVDTNMSFVDVSMYSKARIFPGLVGAQVPRLNDVNKSFDFSFDEEITSRTLRINVAPQPLFSTGYYAPAGELVRVIVPEGVTGLTLQIGAHEDDLSSLPVPRRHPLIYTTTELYPGVNYLRNLFGGIIWIKAKHSINSTVTLNFSGVVETTDFTLGEDTHASWLAKLQATEVPWLELKSEKVIFTVPRYMILRMHQLGTMPDIEAVMEEWDKVVKLDFYDWVGLVENDPEPKHRAPQLPERGVLDIHPVAGYAHSGFPIVAQLDDYWTDEWTNLQTILEGNAWGTYHEFGHNYQQGNTWSWTALGEVSNNLFVFKGAHRNGTFPPFADVHRQLPIALAWAASSGTKNFDSQSHPFFKLAPFIQIFHLAYNPDTGQDGWDFFPYLNRRAREALRLSNNDQDKRDFFYEALCDYTKIDYLPFFQAWGLQVSSLSQNTVQGKGYPKLTKEIWKYNPITQTGGDTDIPEENSVLALKGATTAAKLADANLFNFGVNPTVSVQLVLKAPSGSFGYPNIFGKKEKSLGPGGWQIFSAGTNWELRANNMSPGWISGGVINDNTWRVLTVVWNAANSTVKVYNNGVHMNTGTMTAGTLDTTFPLTLGQLPDYTNANYEVQFKEIRIFDTALSDATIAAHCETKITADHPDYNSLIGFWKFDEASGTVVRSEINSNQNLQIQGAEYSWRKLFDLPKALCN